MFIFFRHKNNDTQKEFNQKIGEIYQKLSEKSFSKFVEVIASPRQIFWRSFLAGIARGIGTAIGFSILGALLIYLFRYIVMLNLPVIGAFIKDIWEIVQNQ
ncbi:MAG: hypothetical protein IJ220_09315 [Clostridia bacterium]|nr:hypothetical protein [Clostridia bacterium]